MSFMFSATSDIFSEKILYYKLFSPQKFFFFSGMFGLIYSGLVLQEGRLWSEPGRGKSRSHNSQRPCYQSILLGQKRFKFN